MRAAAVQLNSNENKERNLAKANELTRAAAADGAQLVVLPEKFNVLGTHEDRRCERKRKRPHRHAAHQCAMTGAAPYRSAAATAPTAV